MSVKLIGITQPCGELKDLNPQQLISYTARVSSPNNQNNHDTASKLLKYCIKNKHWSIFEQVDMTLEVTTSRAISHQIIRHKSFFFQEFCISGDSLITVYSNKNKTPEYISIEELYKKQFGKNKQTFRTVNYDESNERFTISNIKEVFKTGKKQCFKLTLENGKTIKATKEHKFLTENGFMTMEKALGLNLNNNIANMSKRTKLAVNNCDINHMTQSKNNLNFPLFLNVTDIQYVGYLDTYDLEVDHKSHNYIANGIVVHNSQRYAEAHNYVQVVPRRQDLKNRQNSIDDIDESTKNWFNHVQQHLYNEAYSYYKEGLNKGLAKESMRFLLPESMETKLYMKGSIRSWITYLMVRLEKGLKKTSQMYPMLLSNYTLRFLTNVYFIISNEFKLRLS
jgi:thymidylate synthase ThyX